MKFSWKTIPLGIYLLALPYLASAHGISDADKKLMLEGGYFDFLWLGASHMLTGYDHLLFLFGVIFFLKRFREIVTLVSAFTLGHSLTLIIATLLKITANYYLIDAVIALSVCYKGFDNLGGFLKYLEIESPNLIRVVLLFGLIHGFGLSTRLQQLPLGEDQVGLLLRILYFNLGVEVGQIIALTVMIFFLAGWRKTSSFAQFSKISNAGLIIAGSLLFLMQMHGYLHTQYPDDFGFNEDAHYHSHEDMKQEEEVKKSQAEWEKLGEGLIQ